MDFFQFISSLPHTALVIWFFVTGSIFGSFANVLIHRTLRMIQKEEESEGFSENPAGGDFPPAPEGESSPTSPKGDSQPFAEKPPFPVSSEESLRNPPSAASDDLPYMSLKGMVADRLEQHFQMAALLADCLIKKPFGTLYRKAVTLSLRLLGVLKGVFPKAGIFKNAAVRRGEKAHTVSKEGGGDEAENGEGFSLDIMGRSRCPHCDYNIPFYLNIPVLSWFFLRGLCKNCRGKISFRYPLVEFLTACLFAGLFALIGWKWFLLEALIFVFGLIVVSFIDLKKMILPSFFTLPGVYIGLAGGFFNPERAFSSAVLGWLSGGFILWLSGYLYFQIRNQEGMGDGDVSLMGWIGAVLGWRSIAFVLIFSCFLGVLAGMWVIFRKNKSARTPFPFGPCLAVGAVSYILLYFSFPEILHIFFPVDFF